MNGGEEQFMTEMVDSSVMDALKPSPEKSKLQDDLDARLSEWFKFFTTKMNPRVMFNEEAGITPAGKLPNPLKTIAVKQVLESGRESVPRLRDVPITHREKSLTLPPVVVRLFMILNHLDGLEKDELCLPLTTMETMLGLGEPGRLEQITNGIGVAGLRFDITLFHQRLDGAMVQNYTLNQGEVGGSWPRLKGEMVKMVKGVGERGNVVGELGFIKDEALMIHDRETRELWKQRKELPLVLYVTHDFRSVYDIQGGDSCGSDVWPKINRPHIYAYRDIRGQVFTDNVWGKNTRGEVGDG